MNGYPQVGRYGFDRMIMKAQEINDALQRAECFSHHRYIIGDDYQRLTVGDNGDDVGISLFLEKFK